MFEHTSKAALKIGEVSEGRAITEEGKHWPSVQVARHPGYVSVAEVVVSVVVSVAEAKEESGLVWTCCGSNSDAHFCPGHPVTHCWESLLRQVRVDGRLRRGERLFAPECLT